MFGGRLPWSSVVAWGRNNPVDDSPAYTVGQKWKLERLSVTGCGKKTDWVQKGEPGPCRISQKEQSLSGSPTIPAHYTTKPLVSWKSAFTVYCAGCCVLVGLWRVYPDRFRLKRYQQRQSPWAVPIAVITLVFPCTAIPLAFYPLCRCWWERYPLGTVMAFSISVVCFVPSLKAVLKKIDDTKMLMIFLGVVTVCINAHRLYFLIIIL